MPSHTKLRSFLKTPFFVLRQLRQRRKHLFFNWDFGTSDSRLTESSISNLRKNGISFLPNLLDAESLAACQAEYLRFIEKNKNPYAPSSFLTNNFLDQSKFLSLLALNPTVLDIISGYLGKTFYLTRTEAVRTYPLETSSAGSYQWHHDCQGRQVHLMFLPFGHERGCQGMKYLRGSHNRIYGHYSGLSIGSRIDVDEQKYAKRIIEVAGCAGTVALFDANGLHSGVRSKSKTRDAVIFCYSSRKKNASNIALSQSISQLLSTSQKNFVKYGSNLVLGQY